MVNGEIHYGRFKITLDSNGIADTSSQLGLNNFFPDADYDIVSCEAVPISGGSGISNAVMVVMARKLN